LQREIVMDTETTGLDAKGGDRLIEVGCIEIYNRIPTGAQFHRFINPDGRPVHPEALAVHGIADAFLADKPKFEDVVDDFLAFIGDDPLVIHNASFDVGFLNMEFELLDRPSLSSERVVDTLALARRKHPAGPNSLDALCRRYGIDNSKRDLHGAIVDSLLLAEVYVELLGERQAALGLGHGGDYAGGRAGSKAGGQTVNAQQRPTPLASRLSDDDLRRHAEFVQTLSEAPLWLTAKRRDDGQV
jgi:DNA polymerase III subunit epsilon